MIDNYSEFFENMKITRTLSYEEAYRDFVDTLSECALFYKKDYSQFNKNYSKSASDSGNDISPESDFKLTNEYMSERGWTLNAVKELAKGFNVTGRILNFNQKLIDDNPSRSAPIDYYLFKITDEEFPLQGYSCDGLEDSELIIRYSYGFHKTKYGKVLIDQNMGNINNFLDAIKKLTRKRNKTTIEHLADKLTTSVPRILFSVGAIDNRRIGDFYDPFVDNVLEYDDNTLYLDSLTLNQNLDNINQKELDNAIVKGLDEIGFKGIVVDDGDIKIKLP